jgi:hypothetical protein
MSRYASENHAIAGLKLADDADGAHVSSNQEHADEYYESWRESRNYSDKTA